MIPASSLSQAAPGAAASLAEAAAAAQGSVAVPDGARAAKTRAPRAPAGSGVEKAPAGDAKTLPGLTRATASKSTGSTRRSSGAGYAPAAKTSSTSKAASSKTASSKTASSKASSSKTASSKTPAGLAFLADPKLSIEEKLMKLLAYLNARWDEQLQEKLDRIGADEAAKTSTSSSGSKSKGILGGIASAFSGALGVAADVLKVPAVKTTLKKLGGPVLAAAASALGFPAAAPILLKYGPDVVNAAIGIATAAGSASRTSSSASKTSSPAGALNDSDRQMLVMDIQNIREKQQQMFSLVSNILKSGHDTRMSIVANIR